MKRLHLLCLVAPLMVAGYSVRAAVVADPGDDPVVFQMAEVAVPGGTLRYFIVADY